MRLVVRRSTSNRHGPIDGVVEVVEVERRLVALVPVAAQRERERPIRAEVLEVQVAREPPLAARPLRERRVGGEDLVEERRRAAEERERRSRHRASL